MPTYISNSFLCLVLIAVHKGVTASILQSTDKCGGVLEGLAGAINYKLGQHIKAGYETENCIWTIRTELKSTIQLQLLEDGLNPNSNTNIYISVANASSRFYPERVLTLKKGDRNVYIVSGPLIYVQFVTWPYNHLRTQTGFSLAYRGVGDNIPLPSGSTYKETYKYVLEHSDALQGLQHIPYGPGEMLGDYEIYSLSLVPEIGKNLGVTIVAPVLIGFPDNVSGYYGGCNGHASILAVTEHSYRGPGKLLTMCRPELKFNTTIVSPNPIVLTFYSAGGFIQKKEGFGVKWEQVTR